MLRIIVIFCLMVSFSGQAQQTAKNLFNQYRNALYQIQIIDVDSQNKTSIGSGFRINDQGFLVSNYHVVSDYIYFPDQYEIHYQDHSGNTGTLSLINFDVVNDLSLLKLESLDTATGHAFELADRLPAQGSDVFSLGNPHDLGMIVVPGTFNGLKKHSFYQRIHFTGSINPGMSGGPAVNKTGQVVGVNVATAGNQIGFLIPLAKIQSLASDVLPVPVAQYKSHIQSQLLDNQQSLFEVISKEEWPRMPLGKSLIPEKLSEFINCWGGSNASDKDARFLSISSRCRIGEVIFLNQALQTGEIEVEFEWVESEALNAFQFANLLTQKIGYARPGNKANKDDVTNYSCQQDTVVNKHRVNQRSFLCIRAYKDFNQLFDVLFISASTNHNNASLISHFTLSGVNNDSLQRFTEQFMDAVSWQ